ncbi:hypothetical protein, conserved [Babesia bigemina]|uniref:Uncharacterized protein n=1 Tax=Babesia bigemina TaxID=5866 RepID=A0A061DDM7_BABBI|nr:hypothetical protein, conserved [Babesia bigemina]CDR97549.1 hypothetical protein, conserved [Babesia bigemina]|eukprot:XP_012769735.1 hypothetical protein, conserved [Babesia bigemina]
MVRSASSKTGVRGGREESPYPGSPRTQKWIGNLLPILERYDYNYAEITQLVKACDYNGDKIQQEVDRIMEVNIGHEHGEWTVVNSQQKPKVKATQLLKRPKAPVRGVQKAVTKAPPAKEPQETRRAQVGKEAAAATTPKDSTVEAVASSEAVEPSASVAPQQDQGARAKAPQRNPTEKKQGRNTRRESASKESGKENSKSQQQPQPPKKQLPIQWASLLKKSPEEQSAVPPPSPPSNATAQTANSTPKIPKKKSADERIPEVQEAPVTPDVNNDVEALALAKAEETLKKLEISERIKVEQQLQHKLIQSSPRAEQPHMSPVQARLAVAEDPLPPVVMPKTLSTGIDATAMFSYFDEEPPKVNMWPAGATVGHYQQPSTNRRDYSKYPRSSHMVGGDDGRSNTVQHDGGALVTQNVGGVSQQDEVDTLHGDSSVQQEGVPDAGFQGHWQMGYYRSRYSNPKHQPFSYAYDEDKPKNYRQGASEHYSQKEGRHHLNGVYVNYGYQHDRLQTPPGLVSYYASQQPYYGFSNSTTQANPHAPSDSATSSMWRN